MNLHITRHLLTLSVVALLVAGCGKKDAETVSDPGTTGTTAGASLPADLFLSAAPEGIKTISELKQTAAEGDEVIVQAVVGGRLNPLVAGRAIWTAVDASFTNPCTGPTDCCTTPWDYCCSAPEEIGPNMATIQIVDADGGPLAVDLSNSAKIKPMANLIVKATVAPRPNADILILNATGIYVGE